MRPSIVDENTYILVGSELSYFAAKIRAYLQWKRLPFVQALASKRVYSSIIRPLTHTNFIPILILPSSQTPDTQPKALQDTHDMIRYLEAAHPDTKHAIFPASPELAFTAAWIELLADQWLVIQGRFWMGFEDVLDKQRDFIMAELGDTILGGAKATMEQQIKVDQQGWTDFPKVLPNLGITPATANAIKEQYFTILGLLNRHFEEYRFVLGDRISLADFSLFAPFYSLARQPVSGFEMKTRAPAVWGWVERVNGIGRAGSAHGGVVVLGEDGVWRDEYPTVENKELPETLLPLLELWLGDYVPILAESCKQVGEFLERGMGKPVEGRKGWMVLPRSVGWQWFEIRSGKEGLVGRGRRSVSPHAVWMLQEMVREVYVGREEVGNGVMVRAVGEVMAKFGAWRRCVEWVIGGKWVIERVENKLIAGPRVEEAKL